MPEWSQRDVPRPPERDRLMREALRDRVIVTLLDDPEFGYDGLLVDVDDRVLVMVNTWRVDQKGRRVGIDGALYLERHRVAYIQRPGGIPGPEGAARDVPE